MKDVAFNGLVTTGGRHNAMKTRVGSRVSFSRIYCVKGNKYLSMRLDGKLYPVLIGPELNQEAWQRWFERLLKMLSKRKQVSSGPHGPP